MKLLAKINWAIFETAVEIYKRIQQSFIVIRHKEYQYSTSGSQTERHRDRLRKTFYRTKLELLLPRLFTQRGIYIEWKRAKESKERTQSRSMLAIRPACMGHCHRTRSRLDDIASLTLLLQLSASSEQRGNNALFVRRLGLTDQVLPQCTAHIIKQDNRTYCLVWWSEDDFSCDIRVVLTQHLNMF